MFRLKNSLHIEYLIVDGDIAYEGTGSGISCVSSDSLIWLISDFIALTFRRRIKSRLPFAGIIRRLPYSTRFQDKG